MDAVKLFTEHILFKFPYATAGTNSLNISDIIGNALGAIIGVIGAYCVMRFQFNKEKEIKHIENEEMIKSIEKYLVDTYLPILNTQLQLLESSIRDNVFARFAHQDFDSSYLMLLDNNDRLKVLTIITKTRLLSANWELLLKMQEDENHIVLSSYDNAERKKSMALIAKTKLNHIKNITDLVEEIKGLINEFIERKKR